AGPVVVGFSVQRGRRWVVGRSMDTRRVDAVYHDRTGLPHIVDPGLIEQVGWDRYRVRLDPVRPSGRVEAQMTWVAPLSFRAGHRWFDLPRQPRSRKIVALQVTVTPFRVRRPKTRRVQPGRGLHLDLGPVGGTGAIEALLALGPVRKKAAAARPAGLPAGAARPGSGRPAVVGAAGRDGLLALVGRPGARRGGRAHLVFVFDGSRSMWKGAGRDAWNLLLALAKRLGPSARFGLVIYDRKPHVVGGRLLSSGRLDVFRRALLHAHRVNGSDPWSALNAAFSLLSREKGRRLVVLLTDGLDPERAIPVRDRSGIELATVTVRRDRRGVMLSDGGGLGSVLRQMGGLGYEASLSMLRRTEGRTALVKRIADSALVSHLQLVEAGRVSPLSGIMSTRASLLFRRRFAGSAPSVELRYSRQGRWYRTAVHRVAAPARLVGALATAHRVRELAGQAAGRSDPAGRRRLRDEAYRLSKAAGIVSWANFFMALDLSEPFSADRRRFASRWGSRFFARIVAHPDTVHPTDPTWWTAQDRPSHLRVVESGSLTKGIVLRVIRRSYLRSARACYQHKVELGAVPGKVPDGRAVLVMDVTRGEVARAWLERSELHDLKLERCLVNAAYRLVVPRSHNDRTLYRVLYPMRFKMDGRSVEILRNARYRPRVQISRDPLQNLY
ncbi:MAG: VWA domain-containing protein, partial [Deltaproteobacteria bacterium]|nr:VWA domain-containing protein [Deltaproteobacteria bacterium]